MRVMAGVCAKAGVANAPASRREDASAIGKHGLSRRRTALFGEGNWLRRIGLDVDISKGKPGMRMAGPWLLEFGQLRPHHWPWLTRTRLQPALIFGRLACRHANTRMVS